MAMRCAVQTHDFSKQAMVSGLAISVALMVWRTHVQYGWTEMALGQRAWLYWISAFIWVGCAVITKRGGEKWALALTAPPIVLPAFAAGAILLGAVT